MPDVLAVVSNYRRPANVWPVIRRLAEDGGCDIVVADNATGQHQFRPGGIYGDCEVPPVLPVRDIWRWYENSGPPARWYPALAFSHQYRYVLLVDDDHLPSQGLVKALLGQAASLEDRFAVIGRIGRHFDCVDGRWSYRRANRWHGRVDMAGAGYFLVARYLPCAVLLRDELAAAGADPRMLWHDDVLLNCAIQRATGFPSIMPERPWSTHKLPTCGYSFNATDIYRDVRDELIQLCASLGWKSLRGEGKLCKMT